MGAKILGQADLAATTNTTLYTVPSNNEAVVNIIICNRNSTTVYVKVALAAAATPTDAEYIEYDAPVGDTPLHITGVALQALKKVVIYSDTADVSATVLGYEEAA